MLQYKGAWLVKEDKYKLRRQNDIKRINIKKK